MIFFFGYQMNMHVEIFFLQDMYIQQKNLFNDVKMQLKEQIACCYLKNKTTCSYSIFNQNEYTEK